MPSVGLTDYLHRLIFTPPKNDLQKWGGCVILDTFMGSGTTAAAAKANGHRFIGFELSPQYVQMANDRLSRTTRKGFAVQEDLF